MKQQASLVTGSTGDIGGEFAKQLEAAGSDLYLPVRSPDKAKAIFPSASVAALDLANESQVYDYIAGLHQQGVQFEDVVLAAGGRGPNKEFFDSEFPGATPEEKEKNAIETMRKVNYDTKVTFWRALRDIYHGELKNATLYLMGSHAWKFPKGDSKRVNEEGYVRAMIGIHELADEIRAAKLFKEVRLIEPGLVAGDLTSSVFPELIADTSIPRVTKQDLVRNALNGTGLS